MAWFRFVWLRFIRLLLVLAAAAAPAALFGATPPDGNTSQGHFLTGQLLVAAPSMGDPRFRETVIVMVRHSRDGAMGLIINRPAGEQPLADLLQAFGDDAGKAEGKVPIYLGGPVQKELAFVLHGTDYRRTGTMDVTGEIAVTANRDVIRDIAAKTGPQKFMLVFGYAGWGPGQLEGELAGNHWYIAPIDAALVFDLPRDKVWERAVERRTRDL
jgi:putative transcriptional regulator